MVRFALRVNSADDLHSWHIIVEVSACRGFVLFMWIVYMGCTMHCVVRQSIAFGHIAVCVHGVLGCADFVEAMPNIARSNHAET